MYLFSSFMKSSDSLARTMSSLITLLSSMAYVTSMLSPSEIGHDMMTSVSGI